MSRKKIYDNRLSSNDADSKLRAFQYVIEFAEHSSINKQNYYRHFGGEVTTDTTKHPNKLIKLSGHKSTAYGRFQYLFSTWQWLAAKYNIIDISPANQDQLNKYHLIELGVLTALENNNFATAVKKASSQWASLPGSTAGQPKKSLAELESIYNQYLL